MTLRWTSFRVLSYGNGQSVNRGMHEGHFLGRIGFGAAKNGWRIQKAVVEYVEALYVDRYVTNIQLMGRQLPSLYLAKIW